MVFGLNEIEVALDGGGEVYMYLVGSRNGKGGREKSGLWLWP